MTDNSESGKKKYNRNSVMPMEQYQTEMFGGRMRDLMPSEIAMFDLRNKLIKYPTYVGAIGAIEKCHLYGRQLREEPDCLLITGVSGVGKSTIRKSYAAKYPRRELEERTIIPVIQMEIPTSPTIKNVAERILNVLGDPYAEKGSAESKTARIIKLFKECYVEIVILDEFQLFIDNSAGKVEYKVADWLKQLINATKVPFVLTGLPRCKRILEVNEQLRRRFLPQLSLEPFSIKTKSQALEFSDLLYTLDSQIPFANKSAFAESAVISLVYYATHGLIAHLMKLVGGAVRISLEENKDRVDMDALSRAFKANLWGKVGVEGNPFESDFIPRKLNKDGEPFSGYD